MTRPITTFNGKQVPPGHDWRKVWCKRAKKAKAVLFVFSGSFIVSQACYDEFVFTKNMDKHMVCLKAEEDYERADFLHPAKLQDFQMHISGIAMLPSDGMIFDPLNDAHIQELLYELETPTTALQRALSIQRMPSAGLSMQSELCSVCANKIETIQGKIRDAAKEAVTSSSPRQADALYDFVAYDNDQQSEQHEYMIFTKLKPLSASPKDLCRRAGYRSKRHQLASTSTLPRFDELSATRVVSTREVRNPSNAPIGGWWQTQGPDRGWSGRMKVVTRTTPRTRPVSAQVERHI